MLVIGQTLP
ncbi:hypothetical protein Nmel_003226 [Mimus melanotis]